MKRYAVMALALIMVFAAFAACTPSENQEGSVKNTNAPNIIEPKQTDSSVTLSSNPITLKGEDVTAKVGEQFSIFVTLEGNADYSVWSAMDLVISYDPDLYSVDEVVVTELTKDIQMLPNLGYKADQVKVALALPYDLEFGQVLELKCTAKAAGSFTAEFSEERVYIYVIEDNGTPNTIPAALKTETFTVTVTD